MERRLVEESRVHHQSAYMLRELREAVQLLKCLKCNAGCKLFSFTPEGEKTSGDLHSPSAYDCHPQYNRHSESGFWASGFGLLSCLPLIHLSSKLYNFGGLGIADHQISYQ